MNDTDPNSDLEASPERPLHGGCLCGQVRYTVSKVLATGICHCTHCQKQSGSAFSILMILPTPALEVTGDLVTYTDSSDSGAPVYRKFCGTCGSPVISEFGSGQVLAIKAGTLDDYSRLKPTVEYFTRSAQPWMPDTGCAVRFETQPPNE